MRRASPLVWPWLSIGLLPPVESMRMSENRSPVAICTEATFEIAMLSSVLPTSRGLIRATRSGTHLDARREDAIAPGQTAG